MTISRKTFLRVLGGGAIAAAASVVVVPRLDAMPAIAVEGWKGPADAERDPRRRALSWALLAPNPHNLQSWSVDLREPGAITLYVDRAKLLPHTDPFSRQILIGHGCFLEILSMALAVEGYRADIVLFPAGPFGDEQVDDRPVARVTLTKAAGIAGDPLFAQVPRRRTVKTRFEARDLAPAHRDALLANQSGGAATPMLARDAAQVDRLRALCVAGSDIEMTTHRTHKESIDVARVGAAQIAEHRDGISLKGPMIWTLRHAGLMTPEKAMTPGTMAFAGGRDYALGGYASARTFGWMTTPDNARATQIATGRAFVRLALKATELGVAVQPHSQTLQEYPEMAKLRAAMRAETGTAEGATLQMLFRLGYAGDPGPSPRRPLDRIVRI